MDSNFSGFSGVDVSTDVVRWLDSFSELGVQLYEDGYGPFLLAGAVPFFLLMKATDYRRRRREERIWTGAEGAVANVGGLALSKRRRAHELNPALPAVMVRKIPKPYRSIASTKKLWCTPCGEYDEPQMLVAAMTGAMKNLTLFDPTVWNVLRYRKESAVVMDVKGDTVSKFGPRLGGGQWVFTFLEEHDSSSAINLIETPRMAASTAAALYPVRHVKVPAFNMGARDLFEALAEALGYSQNNIVELFHCLKEPERLQKLAERNDRVRAAITGENTKFVSDVITSARLPLAALERPEVARVFAPGPGAPQPHFLEKETVWVCIPQDSEDVALLAGAIVHNLYNRATKSRRGTYFLVDEAGSTITIENLDRYLQVGRGLGAYFFLVLQDVSQLQDKLGSAKTRSVLGNAGVQFWGKSNDSETARYASELSGMVRVQYRNYEHHGGERAWKQFWGAAGAPYRLEDRSRPGLMTEHLHGLPKGWWYAYSGDPTSITLHIPAPMYQWQEKALPAPTGDAYLLAVSEALPEEFTDDRFAGAPAANVGPQEDKEPEKPPQAEPLEEISTPEKVSTAEEPEGRVAQGYEGGRVSRVCSGCGDAVSEAARFCESCGGRL